MLATLSEFKEYLAFVKNKYDSIEVESFDNDLADYESKQLTMKIGKCTFYQRIIINLNK